MRPLSLFLVAILSFSSLFSCNFTNPNNEVGNLNLDHGYNYQNQEKNTTSSQNGLKYHNIYDDGNGMVICRMPLPENWKYNAAKNAEITITAPNNIKVNKTETYNYAYANDAYSLQTLQMANNPNVQVSPVYTLQQILQNNIVPSAKSQGYKLIKSYQMPRVLQFWNRFDSGMLKTGSNRRYHVLGTDWADANGNRSCIILVQSIIAKGNFTSWTLQSTELEAPEQHFETAKEAYILSVANTQINMSWQQYKNKALLQSIRHNEAYWANATKQSQIAHNQRMRAINSRGNTTRSVGKTYSDILDINHAGFLKRSDMNSAGQSKTVNMIGERATISNMATGERYNVEDGSKYYWVNTNGEYFGTNNTFYDPRTDNRINNQEWHQFEVEN
ncbi:hypothetical protein [Hwangdonia lutea]|uniref:Lipoprotein n=1 Tax=Hwangdonia lutea TaxID=3075823 RepID=A0AA97HS52_9FLAO|nr:hypothetical protein [Hwangdonia sp. SCSIO 19198]WOD44148.1 hypothetical protein RNZ46_02535 [Hwangdonia sp. SCSIO 19198]